MFTKKKVIFLLMSLIFIVFLSSCEDISNESYHTNSSDVHIENYSDTNEYVNEVIIEYEELYQDERTTLQILLDVANEHRLGIKKVDEEIVVELAYSRDFVFYDRTPLLMSPYERQRVMAITSTEEAIEDVEVLFEILRYIYGPYQYFGGDGVFEPVKEQIIDDIMNDNIVSSMTLLWSIHRNLLPIISDNHFGIDGVRYGPEYTFLISRDAFFDKTGRGFRNRENGLYIDEIMGHDLLKIMRLQLNEYGQHFYGPVLQQEGISTASHTITILYDDGSSEQLELRYAPTNRNIFQSPSSLTYIDGIPVVSLAWMMGMSAIPLGEYAHNFLSYAVALRDEPVVILDLRSNSGGSPWIPSKWMYLLTGEVVDGNFIQFINWSPEYEYPWRPWGGTPETDPFYFSTEDADFLTPIFLEPTIINGFEVYRFTDRYIIEREQILIVLIDRFTSSAGELFTDMIFNVENTLVIGQNTEGNLISDMTYPRLRLPNSGTIITLGGSVFLWPDGHFAEGAGIAPNVWVTGCALTATIAMLTND